MKVNFHLERSFSFSFASQSVVSLASNYEQTIFFSYQFSKGTINNKQDNNDRYKKVQSGQDISLYHMPASIVAR